ncbi:VanZ family protein [candidate division KSB1 bacterium]
MSKNKFLVYYSPVVLWLMLIFIASSIPTLPDVNKYNFPIDKVVHFLEFSVLGFLLVRAVYFCGTSLDLKMAILITCGIALFFAAVDEFHQLYIPDRIASMADFISDCVGIGVSQTAFVLLIRNRSRKS